MKEKLSAASDDIWVISVKDKIQPIFLFMHGITTKKPKFDWICNEEGTF